MTYFVADRVGLARAAVAADGTVSAVSVFSPFGEPLSNTPLAVAAESISYSGEVHDPYTGLNIYQYRSYNPRLGRWMSPDPSGLRFADLTNPQTFNLYTFVTNDPAKYFDAHGLFEEDAGDDDDDGGWGPGGFQDGGGGYGGGGTVAEGTVAETMVAATVVAAWGGFAGGVMVVAEVLRAQARAAAAVLSVKMCRHWRRTGAGVEESTVGSSAWAKVGMRLIPLFSLQVNG